MWSLGVSVCALCYSNLLRINDSILTIFTLNMKESSLFVSILDHSLAQGRSQLEPFGSAGVVTLQGIAAALLIPQLSFGIVYHGTEQSECLAGLSQRPIWVFLRQNYPMAHAVNLLTHLTIIWPNVSWSCCDLFPSVCLEPTCVLLVDFC